MGNIQFARAVQDLCVFVEAGRGERLKPIARHDGGRRVLVGEYDGSIQIAHQAVVIFVALVEGGEHLPHRVLFVQ